MKPERIGRTTCVETGKKRYPGYWEARAAATDIGHQLGQNHGRPYRCAACRGWHLGKSERTIR